MSYKGVIGIKYKGQIIPPAMVDLLVKDRSCYGLALLEGKDFQLAQEATPITADEFNQFQEGYKDSALAFSFITAPAEGFDQKIVQPFSLVKDKAGTTILLGFLEGEFPGFAKTSSPHSNELHMVDNYLRTFLQQRFDGMPTSEKFFASLADPLLEKQLEVMCMPRGNIMFFANNGEIVRLGTGEPAGQSYDWGAVSNSLGYMETAVVPKKIGIAGKLKALAGGKATAEPQKVVTPDPTQKPVEQPAVPAQPAPVPDAPTTEAAVLIPQVPFTMFTPPKGLNNRAIKKLLNGKLGCLPYQYKETYDKGGAFPVPSDNKLRFTSETYEKFRKSAASSKTNTAETTTNNVGPAEVAKSKDAPKAAATNVIKAPIKQQKKEPMQPLVTNEEQIAAKLGTVSTAAKKKFLEDFQQRPGIMRAIADSREDVLHPQHMAKFDADIATFAEQSGLRQGVYDTLGWSREDLGDFVTNHKELAVALLFDLQNEVAVLKKASGHKSGENKIGLKRSA